MPCKGFLKGSRGNRSEPSAHSDGRGLWLAEDWAYGLGVGVRCGGFQGVICIESIVGCDVC
jgi:hypothetical protein